ncbi:MAG: addiction module protein [Verrucomicrobiota bacterium]
MQYKPKMISEQFPDLQSLDPQQKLILAGELRKEAVSPQENDDELPASAVALIEERLDEFLANPGAGVSWETLKDRVRNGAS